MSRAILASAAALGIAASRGVSARKERRDGKYPGPETCPDCGKKIAGRIALKQHVKAKHP